MLCYLVDPIFQVINTAGKPATGGYIEVYVHGTGDKYYCASDFDGTLHPFKIPLDSLGSNIILADDANAYDIYAYNRYGSLLMSRYNVAVSKSEGGNSSRKGTIHKIGLWPVSSSDPSPKPSEYWVLDLESTNDNEPSGYDRLTVERARDIHNTGSFFGLRTIHVQNPYDDNLLLETYYEYIAMAQTFELKLAYIDDLNQLSEYTLGNFGEYVGVYSVNEKAISVGKLHRYSLGDGTVDGETPIYGSWLIDLDKPDPNGPEGYARVTPAEFWQSTAVNGEVPVYLQDKNANNSLTYAYLSRTDVTKSGSTVTSVFAYFVRSGYGNDLSVYEGFRFTKLEGSDYLQKATATEDYFAALSQTSGDARYLQLSGGTMTGPITLAADGLHTNNAAGFTADQYGNFKHARNNAADDWTLRANSGSATFSFNWETGVINIGIWEATKIGIAYGGTGATSASDARTNLDVYSKSEVDNALPKATSSTPSMDGTASVGSETRWAKGDHVHPTDTSREATANKTTTVRQNGQADNTKFPTEAAVRTAIDSALSSAYHAAGSKTVAQLTSSLLVAANQGNVYNVTDSGTTTADFVEGAGRPITAGDNVGICDVGGGVYKFDLLSGFVDLSGYLAANGDGSDVTASFTATSTRTNISTGEKLSILFGKIAKWLGDLKALAFKDKVDTADIETNAVTADKVKDDETLPVNVTGSAAYATTADTAIKLPTAYGGFDYQEGYRLLATVTAPSAWSDRICSFSVFETAAGKTDPSGLKGTLTVQIRNNSGSYSYGAYYRGVDSNDFDIIVISNDNHSISVYVYSSGGKYGGLQLVLASSSGYTGNPKGLSGLTLYSNNGIQATVTGNAVIIYKAVTPVGNGWVPLSNSSGVGSSLEPVYVSSGGNVLKCENRIHDLTLQSKTIKVAGEMTNRYLVCDRQDWTGTANNPVFTPVDPYALAEWINRGDVIQVDFTTYDWWGEKYPGLIVEAQCSTLSGDTRVICTNLRVLRQKIVNQQPTMNFAWSNIITDEDTNIKYMEFQSL